MLQIYLDVCCLNRPFDDQKQDRIRLESEAVLIILNHLQTQSWQWVGSEVVDYEIEQTPDYSRRLRLQLLTAYVHRSVLVEAKELERAKQLQGLGFHAYDAQHIACAESADADVLLTTDEKLLRRASHLADQLYVRVANPLKWLNEVI